ncbi:MAG: amidohydrolase [Actinomycetota bacterium]|nr:MAG: amidohydrolase [Actinomycetota bacterium]
MRTLYRASRVHTLAHPATGEWVLVDGRHVERVGVGDPPSADRVVDLPGATILPGFVDAHVHLTGTGIHQQAPEVGRARSAPELLEALRGVLARRTGPTLVHGWDESAWDLREPPTRAELDALTDRPLTAVRADGHLSLANSPALVLSGALALPGVERDAAGEPTGVVRGEANVALQRWFTVNLSRHDLEALQLSAAALAASHGVTCVHEMSMIDQRGMGELEVLLAQRERLPVDVVPYPVTTDVGRAIELGLPRVGGDLPVDGSIGARTAWLREPYRDAGHRGTAFLAGEELATFLRDGHLAGLQVGVHAIGDAALAAVIEAWEAVYRALDSRGRRHLRARRHRIEHAEMLEPDLLERAAMLGLALSVQPSFDAAWGGPGGLYEQALGAERAGAMNPFRSILARGMEMGAGSDSPIVTIDPMAAIAAFEGHHEPSERLLREEAVRAHTIGGARLAHQEGKKGALEPGAHADLVAYPADPLDPGVSLEGLRPLLTVSLGREVHVS